LPLGWPQAVKPVAKAKMAGSTHRVPSLPAMILTPSPNSTPGG